MDLIVGWRAYGLHWPVGVVVLAMMASCAPADAPAGSLPLDALVVCKVAADWAAPQTVGLSEEIPLADVDIGGQARGRFGLAENGVFTTSVFDISGDADDMIGATRVDLEPPSHLQARSVLVDASYVHPTNRGNVRVTCEVP